MTNQIVKLPGPISQALGSALSNLLEEVSKDVGKDIATAYRNWKRSNLQAVFEQANDQIATEEPLLLTADQQLTPGFIFKFIESASNAESSEVQNLWARLLVAATQGKVDENHKAFLEALDSFTPNMALTFLAISSQVTEVARGILVGVPHDNPEAAFALAELSDEKIVSALISLKRLGVIRNIDRRFDLSSRQSLRLSRNVERSLIELSGAIEQLQMASEVPLEDAVERQHFQGKELVVLAVLKTEFGIQLRHVLGLSDK